MTTAAPKFTVTRSQAAEILEVSTRTIDRYIQSNKLSARKKGGNILLSEEEISNFKVSRFQHEYGASPDMPGRVHKHLNNVDSHTVIDGDTGDVEVEEEAQVREEIKAVTASAASTGEREKVFEELYDLSRREIREYHNKLEAANYRLGQIETQLKHSVPLLDYQSTSESLKEKEMQISGKIKHQEEALEMLEGELRGEKLNKNIYIGLLFGLLALQPLLWLLLQS